MQDHSFYKKALTENRRLEQEILSIQQEIAKLPAGKLICSRNGNYIKWYQSDGENLTYISKKDKILAEQLAVKKYFTTQLEDLRQEKRAIDFYLRHHADDSKGAECLLSNESPYAALLSEHFLPVSQEMYEWMTEAYKRNEGYPEQCIYKTNTGHLVRSKSEALIVMLLHIYQIPFRYECALVLGETTIYPDFTILHPQTGQVYYWEHFGLLDNQNYSKNAMAKLQLYISNNIIPSVQLITSYETKEYPLDVSMVENMIKYYFL